MTGKQLFTSKTKRDYSGNEADLYAQTLLTIFINIGDAIYPLLLQAEQNGQKLEIKNFEDNPIDEITADDVILV